MQLIGASLAELRQAIDEAYSTRQFGIGGEASKLQLTSYLEACQTTMDSFDNLSFAFNAEIFVSPGDDNITIRMIGQNQPNFTVSQFKGMFSWAPAYLMVSRPITVLQAP